VETLTFKLLGYNESNIDQNTEKGLNDSAKWEGRIYEVVEQMPSFPGGQGALMQYLANNIKYPVVAQENGVQGRVVVSFVVERDGSITDVQVVRSVDPSLDREAQRVVRSMPKWIPGKQNGQAVRVKYNVPVSFH
jgi:protein TonB